MQDAESPRRHWLVRLFSPWVTIPCGVVLIAVAAPFVYRASRLNGVPAIEVFDVEAYLDFEVDENAGCWPVYRRAFGMLVDPGPYEARDPDLFHDGYVDWEVAVPAFRDYVDANGPALNVWRAAMAAEFTARVHPRDRSADDDEMIRARDWARLAIIQAERARLEGDSEEAWSWYAATLRLSRHLMQRGTLVERLVSIGIIGIAADPIAEWARDNAVNVEQLREARRVLDEITAATPPLADLIRVEYVSTQTAFRNSTPAERASALKSDESTSLSWIENEYALGMRLLDHQFAHALEASRLDWHTVRSRVGTHGYLRAPTYDDALPGDELHERCERGGFVATYGSLITEQLMENGGREASRLRALDVVLAAEIHRREHGAYPEKASDLVPDLLAAVPEDPFAVPGTPLLYAIREARPNAWSIGPNGVNDDGRFLYANDEDDLGVPFGEPTFDEDGSEVVVEPEDAFDE